MQGHIPIYSWLKSFSSDQAITAKRVQYERTSYSNYQALGLDRFLISGHCSCLSLIRGLVRVDAGVTSDTPEVLVRDGIAGVRVRDVILVDVVVLKLLPTVMAVAAIGDVG